MAVCLADVVGDSCGFEAVARCFDLGEFELPAVASQVGTELDAHNVRRVFRKVIEKAGLNPQEWTPRETRHSFVSLLSDSGIPLENISRLVGHSSTLVTETVYRKQLQPVMQEGARAMDLIFPRRASEG